MIHGPYRKRSDVVGFFDQGSTCSLVLTSFAENRSLQGQTVTISIGTVNGPNTRDTKLYIVELLTRRGERKMIKAFGMETISGNVSYIDLQGVKHKFSDHIRSRWDDIQDRPTGEIQLLIGDSGVTW